MVKIWPFSLVVENIKILGQSDTTFFFEDPQSLYRWRYLIFFKDELITN